MWWKQSSRAGATRAIALLPHRHTCCHSPLQISPKKAKKLLQNQLLVQLIPSFPQTVPDPPPDGLVQLQPEEHNSIVDTMHESLIDLICSAFPFFAMLACCKVHT